MVCNRYSVKTRDVLYGMDIEEMDLELIVELIHYICVNKPVSAIEILKEIKLLSYLVKNESLYIASSEMCKSSILSSSYVRVHNYKRCYS